METSEANDVTILGGGLAGLSLALQLRQELPQAKIVVLEKRRHPAPEAAFKVGESTVEVGAYYFGEVLGLKEHIIAEQLPKLGLRFFFPARDNTQIEHRLELGGKVFPPCPSYQLDRGRFENHLGDLCRERGIQFLDEAEIKDVHVGARKGTHVVRYEREGHSHTLSPRWVIDASGRRALLKRKLDLQRPSPHLGNAAWFRLSERIKVDDWSDDPQWQEGYEDDRMRWYSTNHLMGEGYWVWLIPLVSGSTSVGIVATEEHHSLSDFNSFDKALNWLEKYEPQCADVVRQHADSLQDFHAIKNYSTQCKQVFSGRRWGITGEAGYFLDPFYSPGSDFIAFGNTFLTDLVRRDLTGRGFRIRAFTYDRIFQRFYHGTLTAYEGQYKMFGNPIVMPVKILWDYLIYWSITGFFFMQGRMCHSSMYLRNVRRLRRFTEVNHFMQHFFQQWHEQTQHQRREGLVDTHDVPLIREMNERLQQDMTAGEFIRSFRGSLAQLETLACEIVEHSGLPVQTPFQRPEHASVRAGAFDAILLGTEPSRPPAMATS